MMMVNRRRVCGGKPGILPSGYKQLEWIENTINAYINTGVDAYDIGKMVSNMQYLNIPNINIGDGITTDSWYMLLGVASISGMKYAVQFGVGRTEKAIIPYNSNWNEVVLDVNNGTGSIDEHSVTIHITRSHNIIYLFKRNEVENRRFVSRRGIVEIYDSQMELLRYYVPCINPNNIVGMYDTAGKQFYSSPNGEPFIAGPGV